MLSCRNLWELGSRPLTAEMTDRSRRKQKVSLKPSRPVGCSNDDDIITTFSGEIFHDIHSDRNHPQQQRVINGTLRWKRHLVAI